MESTPFTIVHSGCEWTPLGRGRNAPIWPVEELFARRPMTLNVRERITAFYPDGIEEGSIIRGLFRKPESWRRAKMRLKRGIVPKRSFRERGGRRVVHPWQQNVLHLDLS